MPIRPGEKPLQDKFEQLCASLQYASLHVVHNIFICFYNFFTFFTWKVFASAPSVKNNLGKVQCWTFTCFPHWGRRRPILEGAVKMYPVWQMIPSKLLLEWAYDWPLWRKTTSGLIWTTRCFSPICNFACGSWDVYLFL